MEGYRAVPDAKTAFSTLADDLLEEDRLDELRRLIEVHRQNHADDPLLALYQGDIDLADKAWDKAADGLLKGLKAAPKATKERFRWKAVLACYRAGRWKEAYEKVLPREETFAQLANLLEQDKKVDDLEQLCQAHWLHRADSPERLFYLSLTKVLRKRPDDAADLLAQKLPQARAGLPAPQLRRSLRPRDGSAGVDDGRLSVGAGQIGRVRDLGRGPGSQEERKRVSDSAE